MTIKMEKGHWKDHTEYQITTYRRAPDGGIAANWTHHKADGTVLHDLPFGYEPRNKGK